MAISLFVSTGILSSRGIGNKPPRALVYELGEKYVRVICPYCHARHSHEIDITDPTKFIEPQSAPCTFLDLEYVLYPPWGPLAQAEWISYKIDWEAPLVKGVGVEPDDNDAGKDVDPEAKTPHCLPVTGKPKQRNGPRKLGGWDSIPWEQSLTNLFWVRDDHQWRFTLGCVRGDATCVEAMLQTHRKESLLGYKYRDGLDCVALAARLGRAGILRILCRHQEHIDNADKYGRTPLMEAAVWGHVEAVDVLLQHNASTQIKDCEGCHAYQCAQTVPDIDRQKDETAYWTITTLLERYEPVLFSPEYALSRPLAKYKFTKIKHTGSYECSFRVCLPATTLTAVASREDRTVAWLDRGPAFSPLFWESGWTGSFLWRDRVLNLCEIIGYQLEQDKRRDASNLPGSFLASHAEKKAIAFYIYNHMVLPGHILGSRPPFNDRTSWWARDNKSAHIRPLLPPLPTVQAVIRITKNPCNDCENFISVVQGRLGIALEVATIEQACDGL